MCESIVGSGEPGDGGEVLDRVMGAGGETALFKAAQNGRLECCRILLQHGADAVKAAKSGERVWVGRGVGGRHGQGLTNTSYLRLLLFIQV